MSFCTKCGYYIPSAAEPRALYQKICTCFAPAPAKPGQIVPVNEPSMPRALPPQSLDPEAPTAAEFVSWLRGFITASGNTASLVQVSAMLKKVRP